MDAALNDAGFGVQFMSAEPKRATETMCPSFAEKEKTAPAAEVHMPAESLPSTEVNTPLVMESTPITETPASATAVEETPEPAAEQPTVFPVQESEPTVTTEAPVPQAEELAPAMQNTAPVQTESMTAETTPPVTLENFTTPEIPADTSVETPSGFTPDMPVDDICAIMTLEEAGNVLVPVGTCKGWTLSQVADRRPASLKWYLNGYNGDDNTLRAGAKIMLEAIASMEKAS